MRTKDYDLDYLYEMDHVDQDKPKVPEIGLDMTRQRYQSVTPGQENMEFSPKEYDENTYSFEVHSEKSGEEVLNKICDQLGVNAATLDPYRVKTFVDSFKKDPQNDASHNEDQDYEDLDWGNDSGDEDPDEIEDEIPGQENADDMHDAEEEEDHALGESYNFYDADDRYLNKQFSFVLEDTDPWKILHKITDVLGINEKFILPKRKKYFIENCLVFHRQGDPIQNPFLV